MKAKIPKHRWAPGVRRLAEIYRAKDGWRWRLWAKNGRVIAESGEAYRSKYKCTEMIVDISCGFGCGFSVEGVLQP